MPVGRDGRRIRDSTKTPTLVNPTLPDYPRFRVPGGTYCFTVNLLERHPHDLLVRHIDHLRAVVRALRQRWHFDSDAWMILSDHLHGVRTLPLGDDDFANR